MNFHQFRRLQSKFQLFSFTISIFLFQACTLIFVLKMNKCHSWESFLRKTNLQHAMHNFYWYITEFYFTSDPFLKRTAKMFREKNIYAVGIEIVKLSIHRNILFFLSALRFSSLLQSGLCRSDGSAAAQKIFSVWLWMYCEHISVYWNSTNDTNFAAAGMETNFSIRPTRSRSFVSVDEIWKLHGMQHSKYFLLHYGCSFEQHIKITSRKHWFKVRLLGFKKYWSQFDLLASSQLLFAYKKPYS
jgi:hypothetical protein